ncbi:MAG: diguanylate cyclase [Candidatus Accumulibacter sp. UW26]|jgi:diguanylate cyclase (GGDEF)-like protein/PAS domain S-box-containing protein
MDDHRPRILLIDDQLTNLDALKAMLMTECALAVAHSGSQGLKLAAECRPDVILINLMMPGRDGYETCRRLKADRRLLDIPLVFVNAPGESTPTTAVVHAISVPLNVEISRRRIRNLLHREQLRRTAETRRRQFSAQQRELQESEAFTHTILNSLTEHLAVLDADGVIVSVNRAWQHFALENGAPELAVNSPGVSYREVCMAAARQPGGDDALRAWAGIEAVLNQSQSHFSLEYPCDSPEVSRWFCMRVYPMLAPCQGVVVVHENITERKQAETALRQSEERLALVLRGTQDGFWDWDLTRNEVYYSPRCWTMLGYSDGECTADVDLYQRLLHPDDLATIRQVYATALAEGSDTHEVEFRLRHKDGHYLHVSSRAIIVRDRQGKLIRISGANRDITPRKRAEETLREQEAFFRLIAENIEGFIAVLDVDGRRVYNCPNYARLLGDRNLAGTSSFAEIHPGDRERVVQTFRETVETGVGHQIEYRFLTANGGIVRMESRGCVIRDNQGRTKCVVVISQDVTEHRNNEEKIRRLAFYDTLTRLPNRVTLYDRLRQAMAASKRSGCHGALMFVDLDNFKPANDTYGHDAGDLLLIEAASRLTRCVREVDTVARFGGDEFVVMLSVLQADKAESTAQAVAVAEKIRRSLSEPYRLAMPDAGATATIISHHCTASIGIAVFLDHEASRSDILRWADAAMYQAKEAGRNAIRVHAESTGPVASPIAAPLHRAAGH